MSPASIILLILVALVAGMAWVVRQASAQQLPEAPATASIYSASDTAGGYGIPPDPTLHVYDPSPCELISLLGPVQVTSRSINGLKLTELLAGGPVALGVPGIGESGCTVEPLDVQLRNDPAQIVVLGAGLVDCLFTDIALGEYMTMVDRAVGIIAASARQPVIRGYNRFAPTDLMTPERLARRDAFDLALATYCRNSGVPFIDVGGVAFRGLPDLAPDQIHPTPEYHHRIAEHIAQRLAEIARV